MIVKQLTSRIRTVNGTSIVVSRSSYRVLDHPLYQVPVAQY